MASNVRKMLTEYWKYFRIPLILFCFGLILNILYETVYINIGAYVGIFIAFLSVSILSTATIVMIYKLYVLYNDHIKERKAFRK